jgi:fumarate hydratase, class II
MKARIEKDTFGPIKVPEDHLWGAQTQRSLQFFAISTETMPPALVHAMARLKRVAAHLNEQLGKLDAQIAQAIMMAADEVIAEKWPAEFPLSVWQTGSGTQSNMNMNEVLANRASELLGGVRGGARKVHPNDHVNRGQSSNDTFPTAMHVAAVLEIEHRLLPALKALRTTLAIKSAAFYDIVKIGRTHLQDATPLTLGQELSGYVAQLDIAEQQIRATLSGLHQLAIGGTAVGTGLNAHPQFSVKVAAELAHSTGSALCRRRINFKPWPRTTLCCSPMGR